MLDETPLALPDWNGHNPIDALRNNVRAYGVSLPVLAPATVIRVTGGASSPPTPTCAPALPQGQQPRGGRVRLGEARLQRARAAMRSNLWDGKGHTAGLPSPGALLTGARDNAVGGPADATAWPARAADTLW